MCKQINVISFNYYKVIFIINSKKKKNYLYFLFCNCKLRTPSRSIILWLLRGTVLASLKHDTPTALWPSPSRTRTMLTRNADL